MLDLLITILICLFVLNRCVSWPVCVDIDDKTHCIKISEGK